MNKRQGASADSTHSLTLAGARRAVEQAIHQLEAKRGTAAAKLLSERVTPWFYASARKYADTLAGAQAHTTARWYTEQAIHLIKARERNQARDLLHDYVLPWLVSPGPRSVAPVTTPPSGVLGIADTTETPPVASAPAADAATFSATLLAQGDARQVLKFNTGAALQKRMFADGLVPNSAEFQLTQQNVTYVGQRAEHLLTGQVRVYYAPTTNFNDVKYVLSGGAPALNTPFKGGNRITQHYGERPEYYKQFHLAGHEGLDLVPSDGDRDIYAVEEGVIVKDIDIPGDPKVNAYGIYAVVYNRAQGRTWYYCHMVEDNVSQNQTVRRGDKIGRMGGTGNVQGDHLHLGMRPVDGLGLPKNPNNGDKGFEDPEPIVNALNAAEESSALRDALLQKGESSQVIAFNTQAALQKQIFADAFCPNSAEFNIAFGGSTYVAQRAENLNSGKVRVYYAPTTDFNNVQFVEAS